MNIPTPADPVMEMAERLVRDMYPGGLPAHFRRYYTEVAAATIRATTEAAAVLADSKPGWIQPRDVAAALRANKHIKGSDDV